MQEAIDRAAIRMATNNHMPRSESGDGVLNASGHAGARRTVRRGRNA
jgi:hypothetical protein